MIIGVLISCGIISISVVVCTYKTIYDLPKLSIIIGILGIILTYLLIGNQFNNYKILDIYHPVYSDSESNISTLAIIVSIIGGMTLTIPINLYYVIKEKREEAKIKKHINELKKEKD